MAVENLVFSAALKLSDLPLRAVKPQRIVDARLHPVVIAAGALAAEAVPRSLLKTLRSSLA